MGLQASRKKLLWSFASIKSRLESPAYLFLSRDAKAKSEEAALVEFGSWIQPQTESTDCCHRLAALALVGSHRARTIKHHPPSDV